MGKRLYIQSLDGIRAVAVLLVFLGHAGIPIVPAGFVLTPHSIPCALFAFLLTFVFSWGMYRYVEKRFAQMRKRMHA